MEKITTFITFILAVSLASERLVTIIKTIFPKWLAEENKTPAMEVDLIKDRGRQITVIVLAYVSALLTTFAVNEFKWDPILITGYVKGFHPAIIALMASGGSAFWNNLLGYTKAIKDIKIQEKASGTLRFHAQATALGVEAKDAGKTAK